MCDVDVNEMAAAAFAAAAAAGGQKSVEKSRGKGHK